MKYDELSPLAQDILEGYYILCDGAEALESAIYDYLSRTPDSGMLEWSADGETPVSPQEFLSAIAELISYFQLKETIVHESPKQKIGALLRLARASRRTRASRSL
jgi:hypothetical protein